MATVYLGLGANLGDRAAHILNALALLGRRGVTLDGLSPLYETEPWGLAGQPRFLNGACRVRTRLGPVPLLAVLKGVEHDLGRVPTVRYGPRPIDLDILLYDHRVVAIADPPLTIPHAGLLERATALVPLVDLAPDLVHPLTGRTLRAHLAALGDIRGLAPYPPGLPA